MAISITEARALYDAGASVAHVAGQLGVSLRGFRALRETHGWPLRPPVALKKDKRKKPVARAKTSAPRPAPACAPVDARALRRQLEGRLHKEIADVGARLANESSTAAERTARTLASLVKSLAELRRLEALEPSVEGASGDPHDRDDRPPRDLDALREELARALERLSNG